MPSIGPGITRKADSWRARPGCVSAPGPVPGTGRYSGNGEKGRLAPQLLGGVRCCSRKALDAAQSPLERPPEGEWTSHTLEPR